MYIIDSNPPHYKYILSLSISIVIDSNSVKTQAVSGNPTDYTFVHITHCKNVSKDLSHKYLFIYKIECNK